MTSFDDFEDDQPRLGMQWISRSATETLEGEAPPPVTSGPATVNSLWPERWPAIALQSCIDEVVAAPPELRLQVKNNLPCATCDFATACLNAKRKEIGSLMYDREILTQPRTSESSLFPAELIRPLRNEHLTCVPHYRKPFSVEHEYVVVQAWDVAWSEKTGGDYLVCMTAVTHLKSGRRTLLDVSRWRGKTFDEQMRLIELYWSRYGADLVVIESDAAQQIWSQQIRVNTDVPVMQHAAGDGKQSLATGVPSLLLKLENRKWEFPAAEGHNSEHMAAFFTELEAFGWQDGKLQGVGEHDDTVMCFWHLNWGIDRLTREGARERYAGLQPGATM